MLRIRLQRIGRRNQPFYRLVVSEHSAPVKGASMELLGHYNSLRTPKLLELKKERILHWISKGAQPSQSVARLLAKNGLKEMEKFIETRKMKPSNTEVAAKKQKEEAAEARKAGIEAKKQAAETAATAPVESTPPEEIPEVTPPEAPEEVPAESVAEVPAEETQA